LEDIDWKVTGAAALILSPFKAVRDLGDLCVADVRVGEAATRDESIFLL
jgi:predicted RND superfamily exporter protein